LNGKLEHGSVEKLITQRTDIHFPKPRVLSITQSSELGTVYSCEELVLLTETAHRFGLRTHMDGARLANAIAAMKVSPSEVTWKAGVDVLCLGGAKLGLPVGEAVVFFDKELANEFAYRCKQAGQLASKMRFLTAPWLGILSDSAWLRHAAHANRMAQLLAHGLQNIAGTQLLYPVEANAVFASLPSECHRHLTTMGWHYYTFIGQGGARFMCSWATTEGDVDLLLKDIRSAIPS
jgi:threonine aldolase